MQPLKPTLMEEFKDFLLKGNILQLAIAFVLGVAFAAVVTSFVDDILMALIAAIFGEPNFASLTLSVGDGVIRYGAFLTVVVSFVIIGAALFAVAKVAKRMERPKTITLDEPEPPTQTELLAEIRDLLALRQTAPRR